jgi:BirA family biotin operon repressor/biotin-[acetyl-CoA-carboxylase] ligase
VTHDEQQHQSWGTEGLWHRLRPLLPGLSIEVIERTDSTNSELLARARVRPDLLPETEAALVHRSAERGTFGRRAQDSQPCLLVAEHQTGGRGRQGRSWLSERGASLTFSLGLPLAPADWSGLSLVVGLVVAEALDPVEADAGAPRLMLKWPNDLWIVGPPPGGAADATSVGRKLGGVLIETVGTGAEGSSRRHTVIGVGLNIMPMGPPESQADWLASYGCLRELDPQASAVSVLAQVAEPLVRGVLEFERTGFAPFVERYRRRDLLAGRRVRTSSREAPEGVAAGVAANGALRLETDLGPVDISVGEVSVRPEGAPHSGPTPLDDGQG